MKSCSSNNGAAYSRPVRALAGTARRVVLGNERGGLMGRRVFLRRCVLVLCASLCFAIALRGSVDPAPFALSQTPAAQAGSSQTSPSGSKTPEQTNTEQYTLSHERQARRWRTRGRATRFTSSLIFWADF